MLYDPELAERYSQCLLSEARVVLSGLSGVRISSVYFGGGTPLTLIETVESLLDIFRQHLVPSAQVAVEVHPDDITSRVASRLADAGVNMVSLGVESLDDGVLEGLGRSHDSASALAALEVLLDTPASSRPFSINVDLITSIPGQSPDSAASDMRRLLECGVDQVSAYPLMDFPFTNMRSRLSLGEQRRLLDTLTSIGSERGYERSSVWTWTKPGSPKYTSITREDYVGIGAGAASHQGHRFWLNTFSVDAYVDAIMNGEASTGSAVALSASFSEQESALYRLFWRCYEGGFDLHSSEAQAIPVLRRLVGIAERLGLVRSVSSTVRITQKGLFLYHLLERYYSRRYIGRLWQTCRESAFPAGVEL